MLVDCELEEASESEPLPFSSVFDVLGVTFDLKPIPEGAFVISNKPSRIEKLEKMIATIRSQGFITFAQASELQGLLNFAVGYFSGKSLKHLVSAFVPMVGDRTLSGAQLLKSLCLLAVHDQQSSAQTT